MTAAVPGTRRVGVKNMIRKKLHENIKTVLFLLAGGAVLVSAPHLKENFLYLSFVILIFILNDIRVQNGDGTLWIPLGFPMLFLALVLEGLPLFMLLSAIWIGAGIFKKHYKDNWKGLTFLALIWVAAASLVGCGYTVAERYLALGSDYFMLPPALRSYSFMLPLAMAVLLTVGFRSFFLERVVLKGFQPVGFRPAGPAWKRSILLTSVFVTGLTFGYYQAFLFLGWYAVPLLIGVGVITDRIFGFYNQQQTKARNMDRKMSEYAGAMEALAGAIEARDSTEFDHLNRVKFYVREMGQALNLPDDEIEALALSAILHDVGKIAVPGYILSKPGRLNTREYQKMIKHPLVALRILRAVKFSTPVLSIIKYHHENYDGSGYPEGLKGEDIPIGARILSVADCYDILTKVRPYRKGWTHGEALEMITRERGKKFDPALVDLFRKNIRRWRSEAGKVVDPACPKENVLYGEEEKTAPVYQENPGMGEISSSYRDIYALYELAETMKNSLNLKKSLTILSNKISRVIPFSCCIIYFFHAEDKTLRPVYVTGADQQAIKQMTIRIGEKLTGWVGANKSSIKMSGICSDFDSIKFVSEGRVKEFRSALSSPLLVDETLIGVISLYETKENEYTDESLKLLDMISRQVANTVYNALMTEEDKSDSLTDSLTGLPNVRYLFDILEYELKQAKRHGRNLALLGMDLDGLKRINEEYGRSMGDKVLVQAAETFKKVIREYDTCVRYAGDEFYVVLPGISREMAGKIVERIQENVTQISVNAAGDEDQPITVTVGISFFPDDGLDIETLISVSHSRLYQEKQAKVQGERSGQMAKSAHIAAEPGPDPLPQG